MVVANRTLSRAWISSSSHIQTLLSTELIKPLTPTPHKKINLTPWDLQLLPYGSIQKGLLYHHHHHPPPDHIHRLKTSLSSALSLFPPFSGRLKFTQHNKNNNTVSCSIDCNNAGALFVHAAADNTSVADIIGPTYIPSSLYSFFPLNGVINYHGTSNPLFAVQVTELLDGTFIACTINHAVADGTSTWNFINSWSQISRANNNSVQKIPKSPTLDRWFPNHTQIPIQFPFTIDEKINPVNPPSPLPLPLPPQRLFHFSKEKIAQLKAKANLEAGVGNKISSLQALSTHLWRAFTRAKRFDVEEEVYYDIDIGVRRRLVPPLEVNYFGNAIMLCKVKMKVGELLGEGGLGKGALEMNKSVGLYSDDDSELRNYYESWLRKPSFIKLGSVANSNSILTSGSPWFDVYGNDFGWGKPVAVRNGASILCSGKICVFPGLEEGSVDLDVCLPFEILEAIGNDHEFMDPVSN